MTDPDEIEEVESEEPKPFILGDGDCVVFDADMLDPDNDDGEPVEGCAVPVLAVQFREGALWWLSGRDRKWHNAEAQEKRAKPAISRVK